MKRTLKKYHKQFAFQPEIVGDYDKNSWNKCVDSICVFGMGGSHLAADIAKSLLSGPLKIQVHSDYAPCPNLMYKLDSDSDNNGSDSDKRPLLVFSSYSGNTEEVLDNYHYYSSPVDSKNQYTQGFRLVITTGGKLLQAALSDGVPYILLPHMPGVQPRYATGLHLRAFLYLIREIGCDDGLFIKSGKLSGKKSFDQKVLKKAGKDLARKLVGNIPLIYSAAGQSGIAYNWKIKFNENAKMPAFINTFPELNHNEMVSFANNNTGLYRNLVVILIRGDGQHPRISARMDEFCNQLRARNYQVIEMNVGAGLLDIFNSLLYADWTSYYLARITGNKPENIDIIEEFKREISDKK